jgi:hypothetical protein
MANTTFKGPVRSEGGFEQISVASGTGVATTNYDIDSSGNVTGSGTMNLRAKVDSSQFDTTDAIDETLTTAQTGTIFSVDGTANKVINLPALSTSNPGIWYEFFLRVVMASDATVTIVLPGSAVSNFYGQLQLAAGTAANPALDVAGDTITLANSTVVNARIRVTCITDDGTNSTWKAETLSSPIATIT